MKLSVAMWHIAMLACSLLVFSTCKKNPVSPPPQQPQVKLTEGEVTTNEAWLTIGYANGGNFALTRDGNIVVSGHFSGTDTTVINDSLMPERTYTYQAKIFLGANGSYSSNPLQVRTMDTTSHNFSWQTFNLGDGNSSKLNDVVIINDTLIYAVGEIYLKDSTGQFNQTIYNIARWDGAHWTLSSATYVPINAIFALSSTDIWAGTSAPYNWDGSSWKGFDVNGLFPGNITKIWASMSSDVYCVGSNGAMMHYNGTVWQSVVSGTNYLISNIWGASGRILCVTAESKLLSISGTFVADTLSWSGIPIRGIWFGDKTPIYVSGQGVWFNDSRGWKQMSGLPDVFFTGIQGNATNDLFVIGAYGTVSHYNGSTWDVYSQFANSIWNFQSLAITNDVVVAVGYESVSIGGRAVAIIGTRTQ